MGELPPPPQPADSVPSRPPVPESAKAASATARGRTALVGKVVLLALLIIGVPVVVTITRNPVNSWIYQYLWVFVIWGAALLIWAYLDDRLPRWFLVLLAVGFFLIKFLNALNG